MSSLTIWGFLVTPQDTPNSVGLRNGGEPIAFHDYLQAQIVSAVLFTVNPKDIVPATISFGSYEDKGVLPLVDSELGTAIWKVWPVDSFQEMLTEYAYRFEVSTKIIE